MANQILAMPHRRAWYAPAGGNRRHHNLHQVHLRSALPYVPAHIKPPWHKGPLPSLSALRSTCEDYPSSYTICTPKLRRLPLGACNFTTIYSYITTPKVHYRYCDESPKGAKTAEGILHSHRASAFLGEYVCLGRRSQNSFGWMGESWTTPRVSVSTLGNGVAGCHERTSLSRKVRQIRTPTRNFNFSCNLRAPISWLTALDRFVLQFELNTLSRHAIDTIHTHLGNWLDRSRLCSSI